jgi:ankyrin repeat protein
MGEAAWLDSAAAALVARPDASEMVRFLLDRLRKTGLDEQLLCGPRALLRFAIEEGMFDPRAESVVSTRTLGAATDVGVFVIPAINGRPEIIEELHAAGARYERGRLREPSPLHFVARHGRSETAPLVVAPLVQLVGIDPNERNSGGFSPLKTLCLHNSSPCAAALAAELLRNGASAQGQYIVNILAGRCRVDEFRAIAPWLTPEELNECSGVSPLAMALQSRCFAFAEALMDTGGVDVNALGSDNVSALYIAACWADYAWGERLLDAGADPNAGTPPLYGLISMAEATENAKSSDDVVKLATLLLDRGADPNAAPVLAHAAYKGLAAVVALLLDRGADPNGGEGQSPLHMAVHTLRPDPAIIERLVRSGARAVRAQRPADFHGPWYTAHTAMTLLTERLVLGVRGPCAERDNPRGYLRARAEIYAMLAAAGDSVAEAVERVGEGGADTRAGTLYHNGHFVPQTPFYIALDRHDDVMADMLAEFAEWPTWTTVALYAPERIARGYLRTADVSSRAVQHALAQGPSAIAATAAKRWSPRRHFHFHARHSSMIELVLLCARCAASRGARDAVVARVPLEVWYAIFAWLGRDGWGTV